MRGLTTRPTRSRRRLLGGALTVVLVAIVGFLAACGDDDDSSSQETESQARQGGYDLLTERQPAETMDYSPSRETINAWIETWDREGQMSFTYLLDQDGDKIGYFVFQGPPVSYCAALTPTYERIKIDGGADNMDVIVPAPGVDGVYYSGGQCVQYYGIDATTGNLLEFTVGGTLNYLSSTQPLYLDENIPPLGPTEISELTPNAEGEYVVEE